MEEYKKFPCQRIGCDAMFTEEDNADDSCRYHESPLFHDGMKEWSCCKQRSHDFSLFLALPGVDHKCPTYRILSLRRCKTGKHTTEKPVMKAVSSVQRQTPCPVSASKQADASKQQCSRCQQGFFCSDHGSQPSPLKPCATSVDSNADGVKSSAVPAKKIIDLNAPQTCRNKACGKVFKEKENHENACEYHPGPAIFHDGRRGWKCCDVHVKEFDEFMTIPPCAKGWHNADPVN